ncbi:hypothetical protein CDAR_399391 [Caerostris darwini]|uniref:Uncharacterized protein n=1 Tax=Caerostris darwini TaxID=1538125 RepID=A0AAV4SY82_9ARAC|nr:hypothetical protein CDAR_399391 [Caerostris darwini]
MWKEDKLQKGVPVDADAMKQTALRRYRHIKEMEPGTPSELKKSMNFLQVQAEWQVLKRHTYHNIKIKEEPASADESAVKESP